ncbi:hypothetical protein HGRIS_012599 [Hohenbuehelia grisea]|uniref:Non-specific serine/threonine protein kinase n=1 Tax=Hohenbuehelia grisea TaxID=104357 RepID=A0ABR3ISW1_9AGAR
MLHTTPPSKEPVLFDLTGEVTRQDLYPCAHGGFSDVWVGLWSYSDPTEARKVAVKVLRPQTYEEAEKSKIDKRLQRELGVWQRLEHRNIVPLLGIVSDFGPYTSMVCPWMEQGNLIKYLEGDALLTLQTKFQVMHDVASGLHYLHSLSIVHGDLTGSNVLISEDGTACLSDFGSSTILADQDSSYYTSCTHGNPRWSAPEIYRTDGLPAITTYSDIYSFGSIMLQVLSGRIPYHYIKADVQVLVYLLQRIRPQRPPDFMTDFHWSFIQRCWMSSPRARPTADEVLAAISFFQRSLSGFLTPPSASIPPFDFTNVTIPQGLPPVQPLASLPMLPSCAIRLPESPKQAPPLELVWAISPRVLLVDDDAVVRKLSSRFLQVFGCTIDVANDGVAAVSKMNLATYDLVFMDIVMPKLDGIAATALIRKFDLMTPIISMTSNSRQNEIQTYFTSGMNDFLSKPFNKEGILTILEKHLVHLKTIQEEARFSPRLSSIFLPLASASSHTDTIPRQPTFTPVKHEAAEDVDNDIIISAKSDEHLDQSHGHLENILINSAGGEIPDQRQLTRFKVVFKTARLVPAVIRSWLATARSSKSRRH